MLWTQTPDAFTIVLDDGRYWTAQAPFRFATPAIVPEDAPPGRFVPVSGFGDVWRGRIVVEGPWPFQEPLFTVLGWAIEPERGLTVATQCQRARAYEEQRCYMGSADGPVVFYGPGSWGVVR